MFLLELHAYFIAQVSIYRQRQVWAAPLVGGARAVVLFNRHVSSDEKFDEHNMTLHWSMVGLPDDAEVGVALLVEWFARASTRCDGFTGLVELPGGCAVQVHGAGHLQGARHRALQGDVPRRCGRPRRPRPQAHPVAVRGPPLAVPSVLCPAISDSAAWQVEAVA